MAMNHEVPQPVTAMRAPGCGRSAARVAATSAARRQHAGWLAISASTYDSATTATPAHKCTEYGSIMQVSAAKSKVVTFVPSR